MREGWLDRGPIGGAVAWSLCAARVRVLPSVHSSSAQVRSTALRTWSAPPTPRVLQVDANAHLWRIDLTATPATMIALVTGSPLSDPRDVSIDPTGSFALVADVGSGRVVLVNGLAAPAAPTSTWLSTFTLDGASDGLYQPYGVAIHTSGTYALVADTGRGRILKATLDPVTGARTGAPIVFLPNVGVQPTSLVGVAGTYDISISPDGTFAAMVSGGRAGALRSRRQGQARPGVVLLAPRLASAGLPKPDLKPSSLRSYVTALCTVQADTVNHHRIIIVDITGSTGVITRYFAAEPEIRGLTIDPTGTVVIAVSVRRPVTLTAPRVARLVRCPCLSRACFVCVQSYNKVHQLFFYDLVMPPFGPGVDGIFNFYQKTPQSSVFSPIGVAAHPTEPYALVVSERCLSCSRSL